MHSEQSQKTTQDVIVNEKVEKSKRDLLKSLAKAGYVAPVALAMMTTKASACSLSC
tara:strand:- start:2628 stop:2795 length:168 start_codon:yes stop_codon:yes gene_type:complete